MSPLKTNALSIYVHYPYCAKLCTFCAFNKYKLPKDLDQADLTKSYLRELDYALALHRQTSDVKIIRSVYFGGGTPSLAPSLVSDVLNHLEMKEYKTSTAEVTLEANPTSLPDPRILNQLGVTRISLGVQSLLDDVQLRKFNREHSAKQSLLALDRLVQGRNYLKDGFSFDLMFANPLNDREAVSVNGTSVLKELKVALPYAKIGGHLSLYELTLEKGTPLAKDVQNGKVVLPGVDRAADEYEAAIDYMAKTPLEHYEVSSFALPSRYSRHNFSFWMHADLIGIGPGAHGRTTQLDGSKYRTRCIPDPKRWKQQVRDIGHGRARVDNISKHFGDECIAVGLRTETGLSKSRFLQETGHELSDAIDLGQVRFLEDEGYLIWQNEGVLLPSLPPEYQRDYLGGYLRATEKGRRLLDMITPMVLR